MTPSAIRLSLALAAAAVLSLGLAAAAAGAQGEGGARKAKIVAQNTPVSTVADSTGTKPGDVQLTRTNRGR